MPSALEVPWWCAGGALVVRWRCLGDALVAPWWCPGVSKAELRQIIARAPTGHHLGTTWAPPGLLGGAFLSLLSLSLSVSVPLSLSLIFYQERERDREREGEREERHKVEMHRSLWREGRYQVATRCSGDALVVPSSLSPCLSVSLSLSLSLSLSFIFYCPGVSTADLARSSPDHRQSTTRAPPGHHQGSLVVPSSLSSPCLFLSLSLSLSFSLIFYQEREREREGEREERHKVEVHRCLWREGRHQVATRCSGDAMVVPSCVLVVPWWCA